MSFGLASKLVGDEKPGGVAAGAVACASLGLPTNIDCLASQAKRNGVN